MPSSPQDSSEPEFDVELEHPLLEEDRYDDGHNKPVREAEVAQAKEDVSSSVVIFTDTDEAVG